MGIGQDLLDIIAFGKSALDEIQDSVTGSLSISYQAIVDLWEIDCQGSWVLWVKTGVEAAAGALYILIVPSFEEVLENYLEPKPGRLGSRRGRPDDRDRRPGRTGRKVLYFKPGIPDVDTEIASWLPGADMLAGRKFGPGEYLFWTGVNVTDRILWNWLLVEVTETFATTWMSALLESGRCAQQNDGTCQFETPEHGSFFAANLWNDKGDLMFFHEEGMFVSNNGYTEILEPATICDSMHIVETNWRILGPNLDAGCTVEVGYRLTGWDQGNNVIYDETHKESVTAGKNQEVLHTTGAVDHSYGGRLWQYKYWYDVVSVNGPQDVTAWSQVSQAVRNKRLE